MAICLDVVLRWRQSTSGKRAGKHILRNVVCVIGIVLSQATLVRAQDAAPIIPPEPTIIPELSKRTGREPMTVEAPTIPDADKPSIEISAGTPSEKLSPIVKQKPKNKNRQRIVIRN